MRKITFGLTRQFCFHSADEVSTQEGDTIRDKVFITLSKDYPKFGLNKKNN